MFDMRRREFITLLGGATVAWPLAARAQQQMPVIEFLGSETPELWVRRLRAFHQGLGETGYVEDRNVTIEYRWAEGHNDRLPALAADRPGGNLTGITSLNVEVGPKRLELLHEAVPAATIVALLVNPTSPTLAQSTAKNLGATARTLGLQMHVVHASTERDFETVFASLLQLRAGALVIGPDALFNSRLEQLAALALRHAVPTVYQFREFPVAGGLMSYGTSITDAYRQVGVYTGRILKGDKPAGLPVQQLAKVELVINLKTAKALGLTFPITLLGRADEVIE